MRMSTMKANDEKVEQIIFLRAIGKTHQQIVEKTGCPESTVMRVAMANDMINAEDWEALCKSVESNSLNRGHVAAVAARLEKEVPPEVEEAFQRCYISKNEYRKNARAAKKAKQEAPEEPAEKEEPAILEPLPPLNGDHWDELKLFLQVILVELRKANEMKEQEFDVVIPKWIGELKDNCNANHDVLSQSVKRCEDKLEAVKINIRKRGLQ